MGDQGRGGLLSPWLRRRRFAAASPHIRGRVLDVGCGVGALLDALGLEGRYVGVDRDREARALAEARHPGQPFLDSLPAEGPFDTVVALALLEHLEDPVGDLRAWRPLLAPGGRVVLTTPTALADRVHGVGAALGLFSREAHAEHQTLFDGPSLRAAAAEAGLCVALERRFLLGLNQLFVLEAVP